MISRLPSPVGRACLFPNMVYRAITAVDCTILRVNKNICIPKYFVYYTKSSMYLNQIDKFVVGTTRLRISRKNLEGIKIYLPKIDVQSKIVSTLDKSQSLIDKRKEQIKALDELVKSQFIELCASGSNEYEHWEKIKIEDMVEQKKRSMRTGPFGSALLHSEFVDEGVFVLGIDNAVKNRFAWDKMRYITEEKYEQLKNYTVFPEDVIITIMGTVGRSAVI